MREVYQSPETENAAERGKSPKKKRILWALLLVPAVLLAAFLIYCIPYYHTHHAPDFPADGTVRIREEKNYYFYDGPGEDSALIFYPGAKVEERSYEDLMVQIAEGGTDCFLVKMPLHIAFFGKNRANAILSSYDYSTWYMGGHSLGGSVAAIYTKAHEDAIDGLFLCASFSTADLSDDPALSVLSVYGSADRVLEHDKYEASRKNYLAGAFTEYVIDGGNHAGFAWYGPQKGDGKASISQAEQITKTAEIFSSWKEAAGSRTE